MPMIAKRHALITLSLLAAVATTTAFTTGCSQITDYSPGGNMRSDDMFTYISTPYEPITVTLYDFRDNEPLWTVDVPIGHKVTVRFLENKAKEGTNRRPDIMQWAIYDQEKRRANLDSTMAVPGADSRMLKVSLRDGVEFPTEDPAPVEFDDPSREWVPVEPRRFRGVPLEQNARQGSYMSDG